MREPMRNLSVSVWLISINMRISSSTHVPAKCEFHYSLQAAVNSAAMNVGVQVSLVDVDPHFFR
jgi:hypothetical protein